MHDDTDHDDDLDEPNPYQSLMRTTPAQRDRTFDLLAEALTLRVAITLGDAQAHDQALTNLRTLITEV